LPSAAGACHRGGSEYPRIAGCSARAYRAAPILALSQQVPMADPGVPDPPQRDAVFRMIQWVVLADVVIGLGLAAFGRFVWHDPAFVIVGLGLAAIGAVMTLFFRLLAQRRPNG